MKIEFVALTIHGHYLQLTTDQFLGPSPALAATGTGVGPASVFRRQELPATHQGSSTVAFMTHDGHYLEVVDPWNLVTASATQVGPDQTFEETWLDDDRIVLRTNRDTFVTAENAGGDRVSVDRTAVGEWEKFFYEVVPEGLLPEGFRPPAPDLGGLLGHVGRAVEHGAGRRPPVQLTPPTRATEEVRRPPRLPGAGG